MSCCLVWSMSMSRHIKPFKNYENKGKERIKFIDLFNVCEIMHWRDLLNFDSFFTSMLKFFIAERYGKIYSSKLWKNEMNVIKADEVVSIAHMKQY